MEGPAYLLDASVFIEAARRYYAFDLEPGVWFWEALLRHADEGVVLSVDRVKKELGRGKDDLADWSKREFSHAFRSTDREDVSDAYRKVMAWVQSQSQFQDAAKAEFAGGADGWLVAFAIVEGQTVVTHEAYNPERRNKVPIPNVCQAFDVRYVDTFTMLREWG